MSVKPFMRSSAEESLTLRYALKFLRMGFHLLPVWGFREPGVCACGMGERCGGPADATGGRPGKHPIGKLVPSGLLDATNNEEIVRSWLGRHPEANIAARTGPESGIWVFDIDAYNGGLSTFGHLTEAYGDFPPTFTVLSGAGDGSRHKYLLYPDHGDIPSELTNKSKILPGIDIRGKNGYIILPGSMHKSGNRYVIEDEDYDVPIAKAPAWLLDMVLVHRKTPQAPVESGLYLSEEAAHDKCEKLMRKVEQESAAGSTRHSLAIWFFNQCRDSAIRYSDAEMWVPALVEAFANSPKTRVLGAVEITRAMNWAYAQPRRDPPPDVARILSPQPAPPPEAPEKSEVSMPTEAPQQASDPRRLVTPSNILEELLAKEITLVPGPLPALNKLLGGGLETGTNVVISTQAGGGKTALLVQMASHAILSGDLYAVLALRDGNQWRDTARLAQMAGIDRFKLREKDPDTVAAARAAVQRYDERLRIYDSLAPGACFEDMVEKALAWTGGKGRLILGTDSIHVFPIKSREEEESKSLYDRVGYRLQAVHDIVIKIDALGITIGQSGRASYGRKNEEENADLITAIAGGHVAENSIDVLAVITKPRKTDKLQFIVLPKSRLGGQGEKVAVHYDADRSLWREAAYSEEDDEITNIKVSRKSAKEEAEAERRRKFEHDVETILKRSVPTGMTTSEVAALCGRDSGSGRKETADVLGALHSRGVVEIKSIEKTDSTGRRQKLNTWTWKHD